MCGSLGHDNLSAIGLASFIANDHVHELHDVMEGLVVPGHEDDSAMMQGVDPSGFEESPSSGLSNPVERSEKDENASSDHDMELSLEVQRELDLISERQKKRAREEGG